jgi:hypothetical protein
MTTFKMLQTLLCSSVCLAMYVGPVVASSDSDPNLNVAVAAHAQSDTLTDAVGLQDKAITLDQAVVKMEAKYRARAVRYNTVDEEGRQIHYIRLITTDRARVFTVNVDAATGRELPIRE